MINPTSISEQTIEQKSNYLVLKDKVFQLSKQAKLACRRITAVVWSSNYCLGHLEEVKYGESILNHVRTFQSVIGLPVYVQSVHNIVSSKILKQKPFIIVSEALRCASFTLLYSLKIGEWAAAYFAKESPKVFSHLLTAKKVIMIAGLSVRVVGNCYSLYALPEERTAYNVTFTLIFASFLGTNIAMLFENTTLKVASLFVTNVITLAGLAFDSAKMIKSLSSRLK